LAASSREAVEVGVELLMGNRSVVADGQSDRQRPTEADGDESNVGCREFFAGCPVVDGGSDEPVEDVACRVTLFGPVAVVKQWMHDVDGAQPGVDGSMQIPTQRLASARLLVERGTALGDRTVEDLDGDRAQQSLLVREVSVERGDADPGAFGNDVSRWFTANLQDDLDRCVDDGSAVSSSVSAHRSAPQLRCSRHKWSIILRLREGAWEES
jgi:hypothetical protein